MRIKVGKFWLPLVTEGRDGELCVEGAICYKCAGETIYVVLDYDRKKQEDHTWLKCKDCGVTIKVDVLEL